MSEQAATQGDHNPLREVWTKIQSPQQGADVSIEERLGKKTSRLVLGIIAFFLAIVIGLVSWMIYKRSEAAMADLLAEKGTSLLNVFEGALRTGMTSQTGLHLQTLLGEISSSSDIEFVAVTMPDGTIIAHSDKSRIGDAIIHNAIALDQAKMEQLAPTEKEKWLVTNMEGRRVFLIYRHFTMGHKNWDKDVPEPTIFLGLEVSPFEITNGQNRSFVTVLALVTMLVVLCGLIALSFAQRAAVSSRKRRHAEKEVQRLEAEVRRTEKLAAVGTLAAGVAHEIRNPLSSIKGYATYFRQRFPADSEDREAADVMVREVDRLNRVITDLLGLSRPDTATLKPVRMEYVIDHVIRVVRHNAAEKKIKVSTSLARSLPPVMGDMERLNQALLNLCLNAIEAMPDGGKLEISASATEDRLCLMVRDNGAGIPADIMASIFDPYFTTKSSGTGLGLPMVYKIVKAHKGEIDVVSNGEDDGWATTFRIWLPLALEEIETQ